MILKNSSSINYPLIFFTVIFLLVSFVPQPLQEQSLIPFRLAMACFFLVVLVSLRGRPGLLSRADWPAWLFLACLVSGTVNAIDHKEAMRFFGYLSSTFLFLFYLGKAAFGSPQGRRSVAYVIIASAFCVALAGVVELLAGRNILYARFIDNPYYTRYVVSLMPRLISTQFNPTVLGTYLLGCIPFCLVLLERKTVFPRLLGGVLLILLTAELLLTFSRGVLLGLLAAAAVYASLRYPRRVLVAGLAMIVICVALFSSCSKTSNFSRFGFQGLVCGSQDSIISDYRFQRMATAWRMFTDHPVCGIGFNHYKLRFDEYTPGSDPDEMLEFKTPDNMFVALLAETGIVGLAGFLVLLTALFMRARKFLRRRGIDAAVAAPVIALAGFCVNMGAYELLYWNNPYMFFCLLCGFIQATKDHDHP